MTENLGHEPGTWDFETLCWVGFYFQPSLELARAQWTTARAAEQTAGELPNPTLTLTPGYDFTHQAGISPWMPSIGLDYLLATAGKRDRAMAAAHANAVAARLEILSAAWQMRSELRKALTDAAGANHRETVLHEQVDAQRAVLVLLEQRFSAGAIAASEVTAARAALLRADAAAGDATTQAALARARVAAALGLPSSALEGLALPVPPMAGDFSPAALAMARRQALRSRSDVLTALAKYQSAQSNLELELARRLPDIHLGPAYQWDQGLNKWSLGISFELPLLNRNEGPIAEAVSRRAEAAAQFNVVQARAVSEIETALAAVQGASAQLNRVRKLRQEVADQATAAQQRRELGSADALDVASARLDVATIETAVLDAESALANADGQLEDALQIPFENMTAVTNPTPGVGEP